MDRLFGVVTGANLVFRVAVGHHLGETSNEFLGFAVVLALVLTFAPEQILKVGIIGSIALLAVAGETPASVGAGLTQPESLAWLIGGLAAIYFMLRYPLLLGPTVIATNVLVFLDGANQLGVPPSEVASMLHAAAS